jgi:hypothetical protein
MNTPDILTKLTQQGVQLWPDNEKISICSPKGVMTPQLHKELVAHKEEIIEFLSVIDIEALAQRLAEESEFDVSDSDIFEI